MIRYDITPVPKPRQTRRDKWQQRDCVMRYRAFADRVRLLGIRIDRPVAIEFVLPMPPSWSAKKRARLLGAEHTAKPDLDNLLKALLDAVHRDDSAVHTIACRKVWGEAGQIVVSSWEWPR